MTPAGFTVAQFSDAPGAAAARSCRRMQANPTPSTSPPPPTTASHQARDQHGDRLRGADAQSWPAACRLLGCALPEQTDMVEKERRASGGWPTRSRAAVFLCSPTRRKLRRRRRLRARLSMLSRRRTADGGAGTARGSGGAAAWRAGPSRTNPGDDPKATGKRRSCPGGGGERRWSGR